MRARNEEVMVFTFIYSSATHKLENIELPESMYEKTGKEWKLLNI